MAQQRPASVLAIAGTDSGGGAGVAADLKTIAAHGLHGCLAVTGVTAQSTAKTFDFQALPPAFVASQISAVCHDIEIDAVKIGMLFGPDTIRRVHEELAKLRAQIVLDPVLVSRTGTPLFESEVLAAYQQLLIPAATVITPNCFEAALLSGIKVVDEETAVAAALAIVEAGARNVVVTGLVAQQSAIDILVMGDRTMFVERSERIETQNVHGTGCSFSSAIACSLATGQPLLESVRLAKQFVHGAIDAAAGLRIGTGQGSISHMFASVEPVLVPLG